MRMTYLVALASTLVAKAAWACPVCGLPLEQGQDAYILMTPIMSLLPLLLVGGVVGWVVVRARRADREEGHPADEAARR